MNKKKEIYFLNAFFASLLKVRKERRKEEGGKNIRTLSDESKVRK